MRIALVSPYDWRYPGGVNSHVRVIASELEDRGHYVRILAPSSGPVADERVIVMGRPYPVATVGTVVRISLNPRLGRRVGGERPHHLMDEIVEPVVGRVRPDLVIGRDLHRQQEIGRAGRGEPRFDPGGLGQSKVRTFTDDTGADFGGAVVYSQTSTGEVEVDKKMNSIMAAKLASSGMRS